MSREKKCKEIRSKNVLRKKSKYQAEKIWKNIWLTNVLRRKLAEKSFEKYRSKRFEKGTVEKGFEKILHMKKVKNIRPKKVLKKS